MRRIWALCAFVASLAMAAGCGPAPDNGIPSVASSVSASPSGGATDLTAYVTCVREHGVDVPDPGPGVQPRVWIRQQAEANPAFDAADIACQSLLPAGAAEPEAPAVSTQRLEQLRAFAVCMRAHEIEMSDPSPDGNMRIGGRLEHSTRAQVLADPAYKAAQEACKDKLPEEETQK